MLSDTFTQLYSVPIEQPSAHHPPDTDVLFAYVLISDRELKYLVERDLFESLEYQLFYDEFTRGGITALSSSSRAIFTKVATEGFKYNALCDTETFVRIVQTVRARNVARIFGERLLREARNGSLETVRSLLVEAGQQLVSNINQAHSLPEILREVERLSHQNQQRSIGIPYRKLSDYVPSLQNEYVVVGARTSVGKTSFALDWVRRLNVPVYILSLEMSRYAIASRFYAMVTRKSYQEAIRTVRQEDIEKVAQKYNVFINDSTNITGEHIPIVFADAHSKGARLFVLDYIQMMYMDKRQERRDLELARISAILRDMSKRYDIPILILAQLNRLVEMRSDNKPRLSDLRDSGSLEMDADVVLLLSRKEAEVEVNVAKNRNGATGSFELYFDKKVMNFYEEPYELHGF